MAGDGIGRPPPRARLKNPGFFPLGRILPNGDPNTKARKPKPLNPSGQIKFWAFRSFVFRVFVLAGISRGGSPDNTATALVGGAVTRKRNYFVSTLLISICRSSSTLNW